MITFDFLWFQIVNGMISGAMYALMATGLALIWGTMRVLNFAHGEFFMLGGFMMLVGLNVLGVPVIPAAMFAALAVFGIAVLLHRAVVAPVMNRPGWEFGTIAVTLGLSIILQDLALLIWGERFQSIPYYVGGIVEILGVRLPLQRVLVFVVALSLVALIAIVLRFTRFGKALRAVASDAEAAEACGIDTGRMHMAVFGIAAVLAGLAGLVLAPILAVNPWMGMPLLLKAFVVVVLGGLGSLPGAVVGGLLLGVVEAIGVTFLSSEWREVMAFALLIVVLWLRPQGLFGVKGREA